MYRSTILHLRFPFSLFLMPVFLFALSQSSQFSLSCAIITGLIVHLLLYPASNGYNSYFDKDKQSIGGLKNPPAVFRSLYYTSIFMDLVALLLGWVMISLQFALMLLLYGLASKAYSHPAVRLKKYPVCGWLVIFFFQGYFTYLFCYMGINAVSFTATLIPAVQIPAILSSILLGGSYPMTQIYQHEEDEQRGDLTLSRVLGVLGTFHFTVAMFLVATAGFIYFFLTYAHWSDLLIFQLFLLPVLFYFISWYLKVRKNPVLADYMHTMRLNWLSAIALNLFFLVEVFR